MKAHIVGHLAAFAIDHSIQWAAKRYDLKDLIAKARESIAWFGSGNISNWLLKQLSKVVTVVEIKAEENEDAGVAVASAPLAEDASSAEGSEEPAVGSFAALAAGKSPERRGGDRWNEIKRSGKESYDHFREKMPWWLGEAILAIITILILVTESKFEQAVEGKIKRLFGREKEQPDLASKALPASDANHAPDTTAIETEEPVAETGEVRKLRMLYIILGTVVAIILATFVVRSLPREYQRMVSLGVFAATLIAIILIGKWLWSSRRPRVEVENEAPAKTNSSFWLMILCVILALGSAAYLSSMVRVEQGAITFVITFISMILLLIVGMRWLAREPKTRARKDPDLEVHGHAKVGFLYRFATITFFILLVLNLLPIRFHQDIGPSPKRSVTTAPVITVSVVLDRPEVKRRWVPANVPVTFALDSKYAVHWQVVRKSDGLEVWKNGVKQDGVRGDISLEEVETFGLAGFGKSVEVEMTTFLKQE